MEFLLIIFIAWLGWIILSAIFEWIKQSVKDNATHNVLKNFNYEKEENEILSINRQYKFKENVNRESILEANKKIIKNLDIQRAQKFIDNLNK